MKWVVKYRNMGISAGKKTIFTLLLVDNQVVIAEDSEDLSYIVRKRQEEYGVTG